MIQLKNLSKTYATKNKGSVRALDGVNLTFPDKGLCLVVGKSGCGKTTLLNVLGGLDVKYEGELIFLNKKMTAKDFADYRKNYVSFVFQDFNLIEDLDVNENLSIGYNFATKDTDSKQEDALKKVGLEDYGYRFPQELSGGEQQRVAIARAILKDSKVLLADEPTGNLDKINSVDIYKLLKEISSKKLVVVVSHDEQLGLEYADYVVRLDEGKVTESNLPQTVCDEQYVTSRRKTIPSKIAWQMAWYEFTRKKSRSVITVIALIICLSLVSFAAPLLFYNSADPHYTLIKQNGYERVLLNNLSYETYNKLLDDGVKLTVCNANRESQNSSLVMSSKEEALSYGIEFYPCDNELPLSADTYYISDKYLQDLILYGNNKASINSQDVALNLTDYALTDVVGGYLDEFGYVKRCAGVYRYPEQPVGASELQSYHNEPYGAYISTEIVADREEFIFIKIAHDGKTEFISGDTESYGVLTSDKEYLGIPSYGGEKYVLLDELGNVTPIYNSSYNHLMQENAVYLSLSCFNSAFGEWYEAQDLIDWGTEGGYYSKLVPEKLGAEISFEVMDRITRQTETLDGLTVKGIIINVESGASDYKVWFGSQQDLLKFDMLVDRFCAWADVTTIKPLRSGMRAISSDYNCGYYSPVTSTANKFEKLQLRSLQSTVVFVSAAMAIVSVLSVALLITGQILSRKREVGIFKALGAKRVDISAIYIFEIIIIATLVTVFSIIFAALETLLFNTLAISFEFNVLSFHFVYALLSIAVTVPLFAMGTLLPILRLNGMNVSEATKKKAGK